MRRPRLSRLLPIVVILSILLGLQPARPAHAATSDQAHKVGAGQYLSLAVRADGTVWAWGNNSWKQVAPPSQWEVHYPVPVEGLTDVVSVVGHERGLALKSDGTVWAWGDRNYGALGDGNESGDTDTPVRVPGLPRVIAIAAGQQFSVALTDTGRVYTWGYNDAGQLGTGSAANAIAKPQLVTGVDSVSAVSTYWKHVVALRRDGTVWVWGDNSSRQLGDATAAIRQRPVKVAGLGGVTRVAASQDYSGAVKSDGSVWLWGTFRTETKAIPWQVSGLPPVVDLSAGGDHFLAPERDGTVWAWGRNRYGVLGVGDAEDRDQPVRVLPLAVDTAPPTWANGNAPVTGISTYDANFDAAFNPPLDGSSATINLEAYDKAGNKGSLPPITVRLLPGPTVAITSPANASILVGESGVVRLAGTLSSPAWRFELVNLDAPYQSLRAGGAVDGLQFIMDIYLPAYRDGVYHVRAVAVTKDGLRSLPNPSGDDIRTITVDAKPPGAPRITSPQPVNGSIVSPTSSITITGNAEPLSTVSVSGNLKAAPVQADTSGVFSMTMAVPGGTACISLIATDLAGNASPGTALCLVRDAVPPVLKTLSVAYDTAKGRRESSSKTANISVDRADRYELRATFNEEIASAKVNGSADGVTFPSKTALSVSLQGLKIGTNTIPVEVADLAGNTTKLNLSLTVIADPNTPVVTVTSATKSFAGAPAPGAAATAITVTGMASKPLKRIQLVNATDGSPTDLAVTPNIDLRNPTRWTARLQVPPTGATWALRVVGTDSAGNTSYPGDKDTVTVVSDPVRPHLTVDLTANLTAGDQLYLLTDGYDAAGHAVNRRLTVKGTATDGQSGVAGVTVAGTKLDVRGAPGSWTFNTAVSLGEGIVTPVSVTALDAAGNASKPYQMNVLMRTVVNRLQVSAKWTKTTGLTVSGSTDAAIKLPSGLVGVIPIEVVIGDKFRSEFSRHTLVTDGVEYNPATGAFKLTVDTSFMGPGEYTVTVKTKAPAEFPRLGTKTQMVTFTIGK